jgi:hypothetical protein
MKPGDSETMTMDESLPLDARALSDSAEFATHDDEFRTQQQKIDRLNQYYDDVVVELRALLGQIHDKGN